MLTEDLLRKLLKIQFLCINKEKITGSQLRIRVKELISTAHLFSLHRCKPSSLCISFIHVLGSESLPVLLYAVLFQSILVASSRPAQSSLSKKKKKNYCKKSSESHKHHPSKEIRINNKPDSLSVCLCAACVSYLWFSVLVFIIPLCRSPVSLSTWWEMGNSSRDSLHVAPLQPCLETR